MNELGRKLDLLYRITKRRLEEGAPDWTWSGERYWFGWRYVGKRGEEVVRVQLFASISDGDDDYTTSTRWMVANGRTSVSYASWISRNGVKR